VVVLEIGARFGSVVAHPGIREDQGADARLGVAKHRSARSCIAQTPQDDLLEPRAFACKYLDRATNVIGDIFKRPRLAIAVTHAAIVETQHGESGSRERT